MDRQDILQRIIAEGGSCDWAYEQEADPLAVCKKCPLAQLQQGANGEWMSCFDAIGCSENEDQDAQYLEAASSLLCDFEIEDLLQGSECEKKQY